MPFVVDNSVVVGWFFESQATSYSDTILERMRSDTAHAPGLWVLEFSNVLRKARLVKKITEARSYDILDQLTALTLVVSWSPVQVNDNMALALRYGLTSYDAAYLDLALRLQLPIATQDDPLQKAAIASGVGVVE